MAKSVQSMRVVWRDTLWHYAMADARKNVRRALNRYATRYLRRHGACRD